METRVLLDQGAQSSLVTPEFVKERGLKVGPLHYLAEGTLELTGVGNIVTNSILGYTIFEVKVDGVKDYAEEHIALVVPDDSKFAKKVPVILGTNCTKRILPIAKESEIDTLHEVWRDTLFNEMLQARYRAVQHGLISCRKQAFARSGQITAPNLDPPPLEEEINPMHILRTKVAIEIPPFSSHIVKAQAVRLPNSSEEVVKILVEPLPSTKTTLHPAVRVQPCYNEVKPKGRNVPVYIVNRTGKTQRIPKGTKVAYAAEVSEVTSSGDLRPTNEPEGSTKPQQSHEERLKKLFELLDLSHLEGWPEAEKQKAKDLMAEFSDIFALHELELGQTKGVTHDIHVTDEVPFKERYRHIPRHQMDEVRTMIEEMLRIGVIKESKSPWCNAVVLARKKNGDLRLCIDFRRLNQRTVKDSYPLPRIKEALDNIKGARFFTSLDLKQGFWEVPMAEEAKAKTAFTVGPLGFYEFERMPFGLCNAPATFQRLMEACLGELVLETCLIYVDDIIVFAETENAHLARLRAVFDRIRDFGLKMRPHKCTFFSRDVDYLGHHISEAGIRPDDSHIARVKEFAPPATVTEVRKFLGFVNHYRRFIKGYSKIARPLQQYTSGDLSKEKSMSITLTPEAIQAFRTLRDACIQAPVLAFADYTKPFILDTDASKEALGAVLSQKQEDGTTRPVAYGSRTTTAGEKNYHSTKLEFLALKWAVTDEFRDYLILQPFKVRTDNNPLTYVFTSPHLDAVGHRWLQQMAGFNFEIDYVKGTSNGAADGLSRIRRIDPEEVKAILNEGMMSPADRAELQRPEILGLQDRLCAEVELDELDEVQPRVELGPTEPQSIQARANCVRTRVNLVQPLRIRPPEWKQEQFRDPALAAIRDWILAKQHSLDPKSYPKDLLVAALKRCTDEKETQAYLRYLNKLKLTNGLLYKEGEKANDDSRTPQFVVPNMYRKRALDGCHRDAGHQGQARTLSLLQDRFWWPGMTEQSREAVRTCSRCTSAAANQEHAPMCPITVTHPMELVHVDVVGIETNPNATRSTVAKVLVVTDHFTRFTQAYLIPNEQAKTIANALWSGFLSVFGAPARLISDQGPSFESKLIAELCALLGVEKVRTTPYHPQGNGQVERANQTLLTMLRKLSTEDKREWYKQLPTLTHAYNCTRSAVTGYSPYFLMFGKRPRTSVDLFFPTAREEPSERNYKRYVTRLRLGLQDAFASAEAAIAKESARQKRYYDTKIRGVVLEKGDIVQLATSAIHQRRKLMDRWSEILYEVTSVSQDIPVLEIQPVGGGKSFRVHRNRLRLLRQGTNCVAARSTHMAEALRNSSVGEQLPVKEGTELRDEGASPPVASAVTETSPGEVSPEGNWVHLPMEAKMREQNSDEPSAETHPLGKTQFGQARHETFTDPGQIVVDDGS